MKLKLMLLAIAASQALTAQVRQEINLKAWEFSRDKASWSQVQIPHDWAIAGPFDKKWDLQTVRIEQNGEKQATEKSGRSGALPWIGEGWYRTSIDIPKGYAAAELVFDGAMAEPQVMINGKEAGYWPYGYNAFRVDATPYMAAGRLDISVHLKNVEESSRWYPGAGLYRPVTLVLKQKTNIDDWSLFVRTLSVDKGTASVAIDMMVNEFHGKVARLTISDADGQTVASAFPIRIKEGHVVGTLKVKSAHLWSPEDPYLYTLKADVMHESGTLYDSKTIKTGIRTVRVSREGGFQLNGQTRKIKGVCLHHDLGPLGAAINKTALIRQIRMMKEMGCDAIRTSHNMPSTWQMEVCDSMGMMVMAESFDMWIYPKCKNGYARFFREWAAKDITNLVLNHRNHPSIVMWSIGNEIPEQ
ncbi:MAG: beta-galactosidase, partial [Prevotella sp.]|nr:beta-galactosidase [Prevotella sp.]